MGGQACVFYGAAEFSRDLDLMVLADFEALAVLRAALNALEAEPIAVPPLESGFLERGHAAHFRCRRKDVAGLRVDVMSRLRGVEEFVRVWERRTTLLVDDTEVDVLAIEDLVAAKKTQRNKDWPMLERLLERAYFSWPRPLSEEQVLFLFRELRTPQLLVELAAQYPELASGTAISRPAVESALRENPAAVAEAMVSEEAAEREKDRAYWAPLKRELEQLRRSMRR